MEKQQEQVQQKEQSPKEEDPKDQEFFVETVVVGGSDADSSHGSGAPMRAGEEIDGAAAAVTYSSGIGVKDEGDGALDATAISPVYHGQWPSPNVT